MEEVLSFPPELHFIAEYHADTKLIGEQMESLGVPTLMLTHLIPPPFSRQAKQGFADDVRAGGYTGKVIVCDDLDSVVLDSAVLNKDAMERS